VNETRQRLFHHLSNTPCVLRAFVADDPFEGRYHFNVNRRVHVMGAGSVESAVGADSTHKSEFALHTLSLSHEIMGSSV
jgi:hypothetical protein